MFHAQFIPLVKIEMSGSVAFLTLDCFLIKEKIMMNFLKKQPTEKKSEVK